MFPLYRRAPLLLLTALLVFAPQILPATGPFPLQYTALLGDGALINAIAVDSNGSAYITGSAASALPVTAGAFHTEYNPASCLAQDGQVTIPCPTAFAAKLSPDGTSLVYLTYLGMQSSGAAGISVDAQGNAWITGGLSSNDLPVTSGAMQTTPSGQFVLKLNPAGSQLAYASYFGAAVQTQALDSAGNLYIGGFAGAGFTATAGAFQTDPGQLSTPGPEAPFVSKINSAGKLVYSTYFHGAGGGVTYLNSIAADSTGSAYIAGEALDTALPTTTGAFQTAATGQSAFVAKLDPAGSNLVYCTYLAANTPSGANAIAVDSQGDAYVTGTIIPNADRQATTFPVTAGAFQTTAPLFPIQWNPRFGFVTKLNAAGSALVYSTLLYDSSQLQPYALAVDSTGSAIVGGGTSAFDFPTTPGALFQCAPSGNSVFLLKLSADGSQAAYSTYLPSDDLVSLTVDASGAIYLAGDSFGSSMPIVPGSFGWTDASGTFLTLLVKMIPEPFAAGSVGCVASDADRSTGAIAPGEVVDIFGYGIGPTETVTATATSGQIPTSVGGVQVLFNGTPAPIFSAGPNRIRAVVPFEIATADLGQQTFTGEMQIFNATGAVEPFDVTVGAATPSVYTVDSGSLQALMINQDGTLNSPANPAPQGSIVTVYATGLNNTQPPLATGAIAQAAAPLALAGQLSMCCAGLNSATVTYAGAAPTMVAGLVQINFQVPATTSPGFASLYIFFLNEVSSQPLYYYRK